jgi:hypothetical protein
LGSATLVPRHPDPAILVLKTAGAGRDARRPFAGLSLLGALKGVLDPIQTKLTFSLLPLRLSLIDLGNLGRAFS